MSSDKTFFLLLFSIFFFPAVKISRERRAENHRETLTFRRDNTIFQKHTSGRHGNAVHKVGEDAMRSYPSYPERHTLCLDGAWEFAWLGDEVDVNTVVPSMEVYDEIAAVPGCFDTAGERIGPPRSRALPPDVPFSGRAEPADLRRSRTLCAVLVRRARDRPQPNSVCRHRIRVSGRRRRP